MKKTVIKGKDASRNLFHLTLTSTRQILRKKWQFFVAGGVVLLLLVGKYSFRAASESNSMPSVSPFRESSMHPDATVPPSTSNKIYVKPQSSPKATPLSSASPAASPVSQATYTVNVTVMKQGYTCSGCKIRKYYASSPTGSYNEYTANENGFYALSYDSSGTYYILAYHSSSPDQTAGQVVNVQGTTSITLNVPTSPQPSPDTEPPTLDAINGPFDWGAEGTCFTINGNQIHDNSSGPFELSWRMDVNGIWSTYTQSDAIKCYQNLSTGSHTVYLKVKDASGNESSPISKSFTES